MYNKICIINTCTVSKCHECIKLSFIGIFDVFLKKTACKTHTKFPFMDEIKIELNWIKLTILAEALQEEADLPV